jgi:hypothetical protein
VSRQSRIGYDFLRCLNTVAGQATRDDVSFRVSIGDSRYRVSRIGLKGHSGERLPIQRHRPARDTPHAESQQVSG